jgi:hypothetical protein
LEETSLSGRHLVSSTNGKLHGIRRNIAETPERESAGNIGFSSEEIRDFLGSEDLSCSHDGLDRLWENY